MNKIIISILSFCALVSTLNIANAQTENTNNDTQTPPAQVSEREPRDGQNRPRPILSPLKRPDVKPQEKPRPASKERLEIMKEKKEEIKDLKDEAKAKFASSTRGERQEIRKELRTDIFKTRHQAIVKQLNVSLSNLDQISSRISSRIDKASQAGRDVTSVKAMLVQAQAKITSAKEAVNVVATFVPPTDPNNSTDTVKPQELVKKAQESIKVARESLNKVVVALAKAMGVKLGPPVPPPPSTQNNESTITPGNN
jgi:hypothetical protein